MSIYNKKQRWKAILFIIALIIIGLSMAYTNWLVDKISKEEERKITLWAKTVSEKADLVKFTNDLFQRFGQEERKKSEIWAKSVQYLVKAPAEVDVSFLLELVKSNETVPVILVLENGKMQHRNLDPKLSNDSLYLLKELEEMKKINPPIEIVLNDGSINYLYYKDSQLFEELKYVLDEMLASFLDEILLNSSSVPVIYTDSTQKIVLNHANLNLGNWNGKTVSNSKQNSDDLLAEIEEMRLQNEPIKVEIHNGTFNYIFYKKSFLLSQMKYFPLIQLFIIGLFVLVSYFLFSSSRKAEQNQVWVGMSKETAHQLGTPISSLLAWIELLKDKYPEDSVLSEMSRDITRLEIITDRFSKIGSEPELKEQDMQQVIEESVNYLKNRLSKKVQFEIISEAQNHYAYLNTPLFGWVIENISKNAVDAMEGTGKLSFHLKNKENKLYIDITDTGKGIPKNKHKAIFKPGYTTKKRGWGLGLTLVKRIIEIYHKGTIFVKQSQPGKGTTFRIILSQMDLKK